MAEWTRVVNSTIHEYSRQREENILRNRKLLAMMQERGRISFGHAGDLMDWKVQYKRAPVSGFADTDTLTFSRRERLKTAQLDYRGYASTDSMTKKERLMNRSTEAIVNVYSEIATNLFDDLEDTFGDELYVDGNATGNSKRIHGAESWFGDTGTGAANGFIVPPSDTYAGLSTVLGNYGGSWSTVSSNVDWPSGTGDAHYDFFSPVIVDYTDTAWTATTKTWANTAIEALRFGILKGKRNKGRKGMLDLILLNDELYRQFLQLLSSEERLTVQRGDKAGGLYALGFSDVVNFDGTDVTFEYGVPSSLGYGWALDYVELCSMQDKLFVPEGPDFDMASQSWRFSIDFYGNLKCNPRYQVKWINKT